jgi:hypothetical protein
MSSAQLIRGLLKRLCQVLAALATSSVHRLSILLSCFRSFVTNIRGYSRHTGIDSTSSAPGSYTVLASASGAWCPQVTLPLPLHTRQTTLAAAGSSTQGVVSSSTPPLTMPVPSTLQQASPSRTSSRAKISFAPIGAVNDSRYDNRRPVYVDSTLYQNRG